jgi:DNA invertase Pin-like site-specific DNA recombinase
MSKLIRRVQSQDRPKTGYVAYYRVSTDKQGESGLGLEAQREAAKRIVRTTPILAEFTEVETAKKSNARNRPQLLAAIAEAKRRDATLLIAKLDRLARNVFFISGLMESGVDFVAADMPQANRLTVHIMAAFAEHEARAISDRTKVALAALKARGVQLGNPRWAETLGKARQARVDQIEKPAAPVIAMLQQQRLEGKTFRQIAENLNAVGVKTPSGAKWYSSTVRGALLA